MKKRIISLLLALVMLFGVLPVTALAESDAVLVEDPGTKKVEVVDNKQEEDKEEETPAPVEKLPATAPPTHNWKSPFALQFDWQACRTDRRSADLYSASTGF